MNENDDHRMGFSCFVLPNQEENKSPPFSPCPYKPMPHYPLFIYITIYRYILNHAIMYILVYKRI